MKGRKIMGELVPYGQPWRTGANPATTLVTPVALKIGDLDVPAGTYTVFTLPESATTWKLIISKKTGEWGIPYPEGSDLGRTPMHVDSLSAPQENMSISFEKTHGATTQLHVKWETTDVWVKVGSEVTLNPSHNNKACSQEQAFVPSESLKICHLDRSIAASCDA